MFILYSDQFKPKCYLKLIKKYIFSEGEQFPLNFDLESHKILSTIIAMSLASHASHLKFRSSLDINFTHSDQKSFQELR